jgi:hypothetical protein
MPVIAHDSGDRIEILWQGGVTSGIYADHRTGGRVIVDVPGDGPTLMRRAEFGRCKIRGGIGQPWGTSLDQHYESLLAEGEVDDTTAR